ncbi:MAG: succinylglutamate desuccinylase [Verrucomicrobia bacterium]|nr:MAG: succinylglutamate desuccinylase [Verrucomicrobiota bacterium]
MGQFAQRLNKNIGAYFGESIDLQQVLCDDLEAARKFGWQIEKLPVSASLDLFAFYRSINLPRKRLYISTGIHGDEPAGPLAVRQLLQENPWPNDLEIWLCPCLNPTGFPLNRRENVDGVDLNRDYRHLQSDEVCAHVAWLQRQPSFDLTLCLHEDWEARGFYLYELNRQHEPSPAEQVIEAVSKVCPIDLSSEIEGRPAQGGIIRPDLDPTQRPEWPEAFYLIQHKTHHGFTLESPSDFLLETRVKALVTAVKTILQEHY